MHANLTSNQCSLRTSIFKLHIYLNITPSESHTSRSSSRDHLLTSLPAETLKMASSQPSLPEQLLQNLRKLAAQMQEPGLSAAKLERTTGLAEQYVALFSQYSERLERTQKESEESLSARKDQLDLREGVLDELQTGVDNARTALEFETTLKQLGLDMGKLEVRDGEFKESLLSSNEKTAGEITKTRAEVTGSEGRLAAALKTRGEGLESILKDCLEATTSCEGNVTAALSTCEQNLAHKVEEMLSAVSTYEDTVKELSKETDESLSSCQEAVLQQVSSCEQAFGGKLDGAMQSWSADLAGLSERVKEVTSSESPLMKSIKGSEGLVKNMGTLLADHMDQMSSSLHAEHKDGMKRLEQKVVDTRAHMDTELESRSKSSVDEVKTALERNATELSSALNEVRLELDGVRMEFAQELQEDRLSSVFGKSARAGEILGRLEDVQKAVEKPDTSVSELKGMLRDLTSASKREEALVRALGNAQDEARDAKADLETCREERERLSSEVSRLNSDMDQLKTKLPTTPRRSERDSGSDDSELSPDAGFESEMAKAADAVELPSGPSVGDLQQRIRELEEELRLSKESRQETAETLVSKKYLDDALAGMTAALSLRDRNEVQAASEEQAKQVAELERQVQESAKRADYAEKESVGLQSKVNELRDQVVALKNEQEAAAPGENEPRSRKRARLQPGSSSSSQRPDETVFSSTCSAIHGAMDRLNVRQQDRPDLAIAEVVLEMTRVLMFDDQEERLMQFVSSDEIGDWVCIGSIAVSDEQPSSNCCCCRLQGGRVNKCLCLRVLDRTTMDVEFGLVDFESQE